MLASFLLNIQQLLMRQPAEGDQETGEENEEEEWMIRATMKTTYM